MIKGLTALALGAAIAFTPVTAAPARADADDVIGIVLGIAALGIVGKAIADRNKDDDRKTVTTRRQVNQIYTHRHNGLGYHRHDASRPHRHGTSGSRPHQLASRWQLPDRCYRTVQTDDRTFRGYGRNCLRKYYDYNASLPRNCRRELFDRNGNRKNIFTQRCLRRAGYLVEAQNR